MRRDFERKEKSKPRPDYTDWLKRRYPPEADRAGPHGPMARCSIGLSLASAPAGQPLPTQRR